MSKPKPASQSEPSAASRSEKSAATSSAPRIGAAVPTAARDDRAVGAEEGDFEKPRAEPMPLERRRQACCASEATVCRQRSLVDDRLGEAPLGGKPRRRTARRQHLVEMPERLVEAGDEADAEAGGERRARLADQLPDPLQPEPVEKRLRLRVDPKRRHRQIGDRLRLLARAGRARLRRNGRAPRRRRRSRRWRRAPQSPGARGGRGNRREAPPPRLRSRVAVAGEEMRAAGNVEEEAVGRIERDERRIAVRPVGDLFEKRAVGRLVRLRHEKVGNRAARIGKAQCRGGCRAARPSASTATTRSAFLIFATTASGTPLRRRAGRAPRRRRRMSRSVGRRGRKRLRMRMGAPASARSLSAARPRVRQSFAHGNSTPP